jgi:two-component system cell cycle response regulator
MGIGAYILIAGASAGADWSTLLEKAGYRCSVAPPGTDQAKTIARENPDVALIGVADENGLDAVRRLKRDAKSRHVPVVAVDVGYDPNALRACYDAGADDVFEDDAEETEILARLVPLVRLSGMEAELLRRAQTAGDFGISVDTGIDVSPPHDDFRLLIVGIGQDQFEAMCPMLSRTGIEYIAEPDPYRARSRLEEERDREFAGALVYVKDGEASDKCAFFFRSVRGDRRLFDLPLFVVAEKGAFDGAEEAYGQGASVVAHTPIDCDFVDVHLRMLHRGRALRRALGIRLARALGANSADVLGSVYSSKFLQAHLTRLNADATGMDRRSAAILFFVPTIGETAALYGADNALQLRRQVADWLSSLVRVEDIVGRVGSDEFLMLLPRTVQEDADRVRRRVIGVLHQSEFGLTDNLPLGIDVYIQSALVTVEPGDNLERLVERASANLA